MICKKCATENNLDAKFCKSCGEEFVNTNIPLGGDERVKVITYFVIIGASCIFFGGGVIPSLVTIASLYIMHKNKSFSSMVMSRKIINAYLGLLGCISLLFAFNYSYDSIKVVVSISFFFGFLCLIPLFNYLYFSVLAKHEQWVIENGIFADAPKESKKQSAIIGRDNLSTFSVADELLKWNELLEKGLISKEEFETAKQKLLQQKDL